MDFPILDASSFQIIKISFLEFKTNCSKRNRLWITDKGQRVAYYTCGKEPLPDYYATSGKISIGYDFEVGKLLVSYNTVDKVQNGLAPEF